MTLQRGAIGVCARAIRRVAEERLAYQCEAGGVQRRDTDKDTGENANERRAHFR